MNTSESIKNLAESLCKAQAEMGGAVKDSKNPFFKSDYADLTSVIKAIKEPFANHGLSYTQFPTNDDGRIGVVTLLMHESGEYLEHSYTLPTTKADPQSAGSAITYARRYALQSIAGIPTADDDAESAMIRNNQNKTAVLSEDQAAEIKGLLAEHSVDVKVFLQHFKTNSVDEMLAVHYSKAVSALKAKANK
tara:strand:+ start:1101 stop:1676 length:576 start_codon:yes stop_codon:yes gene_type:complete